MHREQLYRPLFRKGPGEVPAELVSGDYTLFSSEWPFGSFVSFPVMPQFAALINNLALVTMNDELTQHVLGDCFNPTQFPGKEATDYRRGFESVSYH